MKCKQLQWREQDVPSQEGRVSIVTGANSGIGFQTALVLAQRGATVILACRNHDRGKAAQTRIAQAVPGARIELASLDLADLKSIRSFSQSFSERHSHLDLLINNAGIMMPKRRMETRDGFEMQLGVNHLGHFALTARLLPLLDTANAGRVVTVASLAHYKGRVNLEDLNYQRRTYWRIGSYGQSKLANLLFTFELQRRLQASGSRVIALAAHPGWTSTSLQRHIPGSALFNNVIAMSPAQGALPSLRAATDPSALGGDYFGPNRPGGTHGHPVTVGCSKAARNAKIGRGLWAESEKLTGFSMLSAY